MTSCDELLNRKITKVVEYIFSLKKKKNTTFKLESSHSIDEVFAFVALKQICKSTYIEINRILNFKREAIKKYIT